MRSPPFSFFGNWLALYVNLYCVSYSEMWIELGIRSTHLDQLGTSLGSALDQLGIRAESSEGRL